jgi:enterochelin esterase-like enzyme
MPSPILLKAASEQLLQTHTLQELARLKQSPQVFNKQLIFLYQGDPQTQSVELAGELSGWHSLQLNFQKGPNHLYYYLADLPIDARLEYKLLVNGNWTEDPWNSSSVINGLGGTNSSFEMPDYQSDPYQMGPDNYPSGRLDQITFAGQAISGQRRLQIYLPPHLDRRQRYPVLYIQDGSDYLQRARLAQLLDRLIGSQAIPPVIAICIDPINRFQEYTLNPAYGQLLRQEIMPLIEKRYPVKSDPAHRLLMGSSLGGLTAAYLALEHPRDFGLVLGQSSSFPYQHEYLRGLLESRERLPIRFYLSAGRLESLMGANRKWVDSLIAKHYAHCYQEYNEGHNWTHWSNRLSKGLIYLLGKNKYERSQISG